MKLIHGEELTFSFPVSVDHLINMGNMNTMNEYMDSQFEEQFENTNFTLTDLSYRPTGVDQNDDVMIEVTGTLEDMDT